MAQDRKPSDALARLAYEVGFNQAMRQPKKRATTTRRQVRVDDDSTTWIEEHITIEEF